MALPLESDVMTMIGFGDHYRWSNGSSSCKYVRESAADKLPKAIQKCHDDGKEIAEPNRTLCHLVSRVAYSQCAEVDMMGRPSDAILTKTWQVASDVIQTHIHFFHNKDNADDCQALINNLVNYVEKNYLQNEERQEGDHSHSMLPDRWY